MLFIVFQDDFTSEDFESMSAPLLYKMLRSKVAYPLHSAIRFRREDVVFLYLIEFDSEVADSSRLVPFSSAPLLSNLAPFET